MVILSFAHPASAEYAAALAAGYAVEWTGPTRPLRLIGPTEHEIEMDALGDRIMDALEFRMDRPAPCPEGDADRSFTGSLPLPAEMEGDTCPR